MIEKTKTWHLEFDVVDDIGAFRKETGDLSENIATLPREIMLNNIEKGLVAFTKEQWKGVRTENIKVIVPVEVEE